MITVQGVSKSDFWAVWDAADPHDWTPDDGDVLNWPVLRMANAASAVGVLSEHNAANDHGLNH